MIHLTSLQPNHMINAIDNYPFNVPSIRSLSNMEFTTPVTFFVGENGTGKSTLLEAIAANIGSI